MARVREIARVAPRKAICTAGLAGKGDGETKPERHDTVTVAEAHHCGEGGMNGFRGSATKLASPLFLLILPGVKYIRSHEPPRSPIPASAAAATRALTNSSSFIWWGRRRMTNFSREKRGAKGFGGKREGTLFVKMKINKFLREVVAPSRLTCGSAWVERPVDGYEC